MTESLEQPNLIGFRELDISAADRRYLLEFCESQRNYPLWGETYRMARRVHARSAWAAARAVRDVMHEKGSEIKAKHRTYLCSEAWQRQREKALWTADYKCEVCDNPLDLQVHHKGYPKHGTERRADLEVLCRRCHEKKHEQSSPGAGNRQELG